jgi:hypothetical protein
MFFVGKLSSFCVCFPVALTRLSVDSLSRNKTAGRRLFATTLTTNWHQRAPIHSSLATNRRLFDKCEPFASLPAHYRFSATRQFSTQTPNDTNSDKNQTTNNDSSKTTTNEQEQQRFGASPFSLFTAAVAAGAGTVAGENVDSIRWDDAKLVFFKLFSQAGIAFFYVLMSGLNENKVSSLCIVTMICLQVVLQKLQV